jgi:hypothetical protein
MIIVASFPTINAGIAGMLFSLDTELSFASNPGFIELVFSH